MGCSMRFFINSGIKTKKGSIPWYVLPSTKAQLSLDSGILQLRLLNPRGKCKSSAFESAVDLL